MRGFPVIVLSIVSLIGLAAVQASAAPITVTSWVSTDCDSEGCEGAKISLQVDDLGGGQFKITQGLNLSMYDPGSEKAQSTVQTIGFKAVKNVTNIVSFSAPAGAWNLPMNGANVTGQGCSGKGKDKI
jgi:hypothetical protein